MAGKVNIKFVAILGVSLVVLAGGAAFLAYKVVARSGDDHERAGDKLMEVGDFRGAADEYSMAVSEDRTNVRWLKKWRDALIKVVPETEVAYRDAYQKHYMGILQQLANVQSSDVAAQEDYLRALDEQSRLVGASGQTWTDIATAADRSITALAQVNPDTQRLRRYRGLALLAAARTIDPNEQTKQQIIDDLRAAIEADPNDVEAQLGIAELFVADATRAKRAGRLDEHQRLWDEAKAHLRTLVANSPDDARPMMRLWEMETDEKLEAAKTVATKDAAIREAGAGLDPIVDAVTRMPEAAIDRPFLVRLQRNLFAARKDDGAELWLGVVERLLSTRSQDPVLLLLRAEALGQAGQHEQAIEQYQKIVDMPDLPVSLEGIVLRSQRVSAVAAQVEQTLQIWSKTPEESKPEAMARVKAARDRLAERVSEDNLTLLRADALIAVNDGRNSDAIRLLTELNTRTGASDSGVLFMLAKALERDGSLGAAIQQYDRILTIEPSNYTAQMEATEIEMRLQNVQKAYERIKGLQAVDPDNPRIKTWYETLRTLIENQESDAISDPTMRALLEARRARLQDPPQFATAERILDRLMREQPDDPRPLVERVTVHTARNEIEQAKQLVEQGLEKFPKNQELVLAKLQLQNPDPIWVRLEYIRQSEVPEMDKLLQIFYILRSGNRLEEAEETLRQAIALDPNDSRIIEIQFVEALEAGDFASAREQATLAAKANVDQLNGQLYQARLDLAERKVDAAIATLDRATTQMPFSAPAWRLLGQARIAKGNIETGLDAMRRAMDIRPTDPTTVRPLIGMLIELQRTEEALAVARKARALNPNEPALVSAWLELEEQYGDKDVALSTRERRFTIDPSDAENSLAMARLRTDLGDYAGAAEALASLPKEGPEALGPNSLRARLAGEQGDIEGGARIWAEYIESLEPGQTRLAAMLSLGEYFVRLGQRDESIEAFEAARAAQTPELMEADRRLGDLYFEMGDNETSAAAYKRVLDGGADRDYIVAKRRVEALLRMRLWDEAVAAIEAIEAKQGRDLQTLLLRVDAATGRGDTALARRLVDEAVQLAPTDPLPFIRRAQQSFADPAQAPAVIRDLDQATQIRPSMVLPRRMLAQIYAREGRLSDAVAQLNKIIEFNPFSDQIRLESIIDMVRLGRRDDAMTAARLAVEQRAVDEPLWYVYAGDVMARMEDFRQAVNFYGKGYEQTGKVEHLGRLVDSMLRLRPPQADQAEQAINSLSQDELRDNRMMVEAFRARIDASRGKTPDGLRRLESIYADASKRSDTARAWVGQVDIVLGGDSIKIAEFIEQVQPFAEQPAYMKVLTARHLAQNQARWSEALQGLDGIESDLDPQRDPLSVLDLHRIRANLHYILGDYQKAADEYRAGLRLSPDDSEFNNNLAFTLATHLGKPEDAVAYAERAAARDPDNPAILDTLGVLYYQTNQFAKADQILTRSLEASDDALNRIAANIHLAKVKIALRDFGRARSLAEDARREMGSDPLLQQTYQTELDSLMRELEKTE